MIRGACLHGMVKERNRRTACVFFSSSNNDSTCSSAIICGCLCRSLSGCPAAALEAVAKDPRARALFVVGETARELEVCPGSPAHDVQVAMHGLLELRSSCSPRSSIRK